MVVTACPISRHWPGQHGQRRGRPRPSADPPADRSAPGTPGSHTNSKKKPYPWNVGPVITGPMFHRVGCCGSHWPHGPRRPLRTPQLAVGGCREPSGRRAWDILGPGHIFRAGAGVPGLPRTPDPPLKRRTPPPGVAGALPCGGRDVHRRGRGDHALTMTAMASRRARPDRCTVSTLPFTGPVRRGRAATPPGPARSQKSRRERGLDHQTAA
jgi:hypothetical protein